jgi:putative phosphoribosyl transferase
MPGSQSGARPAASVEVTIETDGQALTGDLTLPEEALGIVVFAHGSGSSRRSVRNLEVAAVLQRAGLATLLFDLLTPAEQIRDEQTRALRFDIPMLGSRLVGVVDWLRSNPSTTALHIGLFGASTGAAAALIAAAERPDAVSAVVSRGGRPDLAMPHLPRVRAPVLLIVGGLDTPVIGMNRSAAKALVCEHELVIVPDATHLFGEPGKLLAAAELASRWFTAHLT